MAPDQTWLLVNNFTTHRERFPSIGTIIDDPLRPTTGLLSDVPIENPWTLGYGVDDSEIVKSSEFALRGSVFAQFCQTVGPKVLGKQSKQTETTYQAEDFDTTCMDQFSTPEELAERAQAEEIKASMAGGLRGYKPVYMVTGLKTAFGFECETQVKREQQAEAKSSGTVTDRASAHGDLLLETAETAVSRERSIIYAYQLHKISRKQVDQYEPRAVFSSADPKETTVEPVEISSVTVEHLQAFARETGDKLVVNLAFERNPPEKCTQQLNCVTLDN